MERSEHKSYVRITSRLNKLISIIRRDVLHRVIAAVTLIAFLATSIQTDLAWAAETPSGLTDVGSEKTGSAGFKELSIKTFSLPEYLGRVNDSWSPSERFTLHASRFTIVHIQDAHCNYGSQKRVAEIIEYLNTNYGINIVNLEGGAEDYDLSIFTNIADRGIRKKASDYFVKAGLVNGAEYFAINNPEKITLWGVEDTKLYVDNLNVYRNSLSHKDEIEKSLKSLSYILTNLKIKIYSKELLDFDIKYSQYKADSIGFKEYISYLFDTAKAKEMDIKPYHNIYLLAQALQEEPGIDFRKANNERDALIDTLQKKLSENAMEEFVVKTVEFKTGKISQKDFYDYLVTKAKKFQIDLKDTPELQKYIAYISSYDAVDKMKVMDEMEGLEAKVKAAMFENDTQKELAGLSKNLAILRNIFGISMTRADYRYYKANEDAFSIRHFTRFIEKEAPLVLSSSLQAIAESGLDQYRDDISKFYEYSFKRDEVFIKNFKPSASNKQPDASRFTLHDQRTAILVTGGFHTENLCEMFKKEGISYISIIPNFKNKDGYTCPYFKILSGEDTLKIKEALPSVLKTALATPSQFTRLYGAVLAGAIPFVADAFTPTSASAAVPAATAAVPPAAALTASLWQTLMPYVIAGLPYVAGVAGAAALVYFGYRAYSKLTALVVMEAPSAPVGAKTPRSETSPAIQGISREGVKNILVLESKLSVDNLQARQAATTALGPVYAALVDKDEMTLAALESKLDDPNEYVRQAATTALGLVYAALVNKDKEVSLAALKYRLSDYNWDVIDAATMALGLVYAALANKGKMTLFALESELKYDNKYVRQAATTALGPVYAALVDKDEMALSALESKLDDPSWYVRLAAATALGLVYTALVNKDKEVSLSDLKGKLSDDNWDVRQAAATALGLVYAALVNKDKEVSLPDLKDKLSDDELQVRQAATITLGPVYAALVNKDKEVSLSDLKDKLSDDNWDVRQAATIALGPVYAALVNKGKMTLSALKDKLKDNNEYVRQAATIALGLVYVALVNKDKEVSLSDLNDKLSDDKLRVRQAAAIALGSVCVALIKKDKLLENEYKKYHLWTLTNLPYLETVIDEYLSSPEAEAYIDSLKRQAVPAINNGFNYADEKELSLGFIGTRMNGININFEEFRDRVNGLAKFDEKHPGYFKRLFTKTKGFKTLEVSAKEGRQIDADKVDIAILEKNLNELLAIKDRINNLKWLNEEFPKSRVFNPRNLYFNLKRQLAINEGKLKEGERFFVKLPSEQEIYTELTGMRIEDKKLFYQIVFKLARDRAGDKSISEKCLSLMRDLIVSDILLDRELLDQMNSSELEAKINAFKNFYEDYKNHLPNSVGVELGNIKGLSDLFSRLSGGVYNELSKINVIKTKTGESYLLVPEGFLSVFRGRAGMIDCSFDKGKGAYTHSMHEDTLYYFVYKAKELKGYVGLCVAKTKDGQKILTIDTINSPSLDGEELLTNLFKALEGLARGLGCIGIALPENITPYFNFDNKTTIKEMRLYKSATPIRVTPFNDISWGYFTKIFGKSRYNSIEVGEFRLLHLKSPEAVRAAALATLVSLLIINPVLALFAQDTQNRIPTQVATEINQIRPLAPEDMERMITDISSSPTEQKAEQKAREFLDTVTPDRVKLINFDRLPEGVPSTFFSVMNELAYRGNPKAIDFLFSLVLQFYKLPEEIKFALIYAMGAVINPENPKAPDLVLQFGKLPEEAQSSFIYVMSELASRGNPKATDFLFSLVPRLQRNTLSVEAREAFLQYFIGDIASNLSADLEGRISDDELTKGTRNNPFVLYTAFASSENFEDLAKIIFTRLEDKARENKEGVGSFILGLDPEKVACKDFMLQLANFNMLDMVISDNKDLESVMNEIFKEVPAEAVGSNATRLAMFVEDIIHNKEFKHQEEFQKYLMRLYKSLEGPNKILIGSLLVKYGDELEYLDREEINGIRKEFNRIREKNEERLKKGEDVWPALITQRPPSPGAAPGGPSVGLLKGLGIRNWMDEDLEVNLIGRHGEFERKTELAKRPLADGAEAKVVQADLGTAGAYHFKASNGQHIIVINSINPTIWQEAIYHEVREIDLMNQDFTKGQHFTQEHTAHVIASAEEVKVYSREGKLTPYHKWQIQKMTVGQLQAIAAEDEEAREIHHSILKEANKHGANINIQMIKNYEEMLRLTALEEIRDREREGAVPGIGAKSAPEAVRAAVLATAGKRIAVLAIFGAAFGNAAALSAAGFEAGGLVTAVASTIPLGWIMAGAAIGVAAIIFVVYKLMSPRVTPPETKKVIADISQTAPVTTTPAATLSAQGTGSSGIERFFDMNIAALNETTGIEQVRAMEENPNVHMVRISNPSESQRTMLPGYFHRPSKIRYVLDLPPGGPGTTVNAAIESYYDRMDSKRRRQFKKDVEKVDQAIEKGEIRLVFDRGESAGDIEEFMRLYEAEMGAKERGRMPLLDSLRRTGVTPQRFLRGDRLAIYIKKGGKIIGGIIAKKYKNRYSISYAATDKESGIRSMQYYLMQTLMRRSIEEGLSRLDYGIDTNLYGHHLSTGLMRAKISSGFRPEAYSDPELVHFTNFDIFDGPLFFYTFGPGDTLESTLIVTDAMLDRIKEFDGAASKLNIFILRGDKLYPFKPVAVPPLIAAPAIGQAGAISKLPVETEIIATGSGPTTVRSTTINLRDWEIRILIPKGLHNNFFIDRLTEVLSLTVGGKTITDQKEIDEYFKKHYLGSKLIEEYKKEYGDGPIALVMDNSCLFSNQGFVTYHNDLAYHTKGENITEPERPYSSLIFTKDGHVLMGDVSYKKLGGSTEEGTPVEISASVIKGEDIDYATFGQFLLNGEGEPRKDFEAIIPQFQDLRHVFGLPKILVSQLGVDPALVAGKSEKWFGVSQLTADGYLLAKKAWTEPVELETYMDVGPENRVPISKDILSKALEEGGYIESADENLDQKGKFRFSDDGKKLKIFLKHGVYPRTIVGRTKEGELKTIQVVGLSGREGTTLEESAKLASDMGLEQAMLLDHGRSAKMSVNGEDRQKEPREVATCVLVASFKGYEAPAAPAPQITPPPDDAMHMESLPLISGGEMMWNGINITKDIVLKEEMNKIKNARPSDISIKLEIGVEKNIWVDNALQAQFAKFGFGGKEEFISFLEKFLAEQFKTSPPIKNEIVIALLDQSTHLFEDHKANGFIGINRQLFDTYDPDKKAYSKGNNISNELRTKLLKIGLRHELRHETGEDDEAKLLKEDIDYSAELFVTINDLESISPLVARDAGFISAFPKKYKPVFDFYDLSDTEFSLAYNSTASEHFVFDREKGKASWDGKETNIRLTSSVSELLKPFKGEQTAAYAAGNFMHNDWFIIYDGTKGKVQCRKGEPKYERLYSMIVAWKNGEVTSEEVSFTSKGDKDIANINGENRSDEINFALFGQRLVHGGQTVPLDQDQAQLYNQFDDLYHLYLLPQFVEYKDDKPVYGEAIGYKELYVGLSAPGRKIDRKRLQDVLKSQGYMQIDLEYLLNTHSIDDIKNKALYLQGYSEKTEGELAEGEFRVEKNILKVRLIRSKYPHNLVGITRSGKMVAINLIGDKFKGIGYRVDELGGLIIKETGKRNDPIQEVFLLANSRDVNKYVNGALVESESSANPYDGASALIVFSGKTGSQLAPGAVAPAAAPAAMLSKEEVSQLEKTAGLLMKYKFDIAGLSSVDNQVKIEEIINSYMMGRTTSAAARAGLELLFGKIRDLLNLRTKNISDKLRGIIETATVPIGAIKVVTRSGEVNLTKLDEENTIISLMKGTVSVFSVEILVQGGKIQYKMSFASPAPATVPEAAELAAAPQITPPSSAAVEPASAVSMSTKELFDYFLRTTSLGKQIEDIQFGKIQQPKDYRWGPNNEFNRLEHVKNVVTVLDSVARRDWQTFRANPYLNAGPDISEKEFNSICDIYFSLSSRYQGILKIATALHDYGRFFDVEDHYKEGALKAEDELSRLGYDAADVALIKLLIKKHADPRKRSQGEMPNLDEVASDNELLKALVIMGIADISSSGDFSLTKERMNKIIGMLPATPTAKFTALEIAQPELATEAVRPVTWEEGVNISAVDFTPKKGGGIVVTVQPNLSQEDWIRPDRRLPVQQHIDILRKRYGQEIKIIGYIGNGNLFSNKGHWVFANGELFYRKDEPLRKRPYTVFAVFKNGNKKILDVRITTDMRIRNIEDKKDITEDLAWAISGERIVRKGAAIDWRKDESFKGYADPRHLFLFPVTLFDNRPQEVQQKTGRKDVFRECLWHEEDKKEIARQGGEIELPLEMFAKYGYTDIGYIEQELIKMGYAKDKDFHFSATALHIILKPGLYQHQTIGLTNNNHVTTIAATSKGEKSLGVTLDQLAEINWKNGVQDAIMLHQGKDVFIFKDGENKAAAFPQSQERFTSMVFLIEGGVGMQPLPKSAASVVLAAPLYEEAQKLVPRIVTAVNRGTITFITAPALEDEIGPDTGFDMSVKRMLRARHDIQARHYLAGSRPDLKSEVENMVPIFAAAVKSTGTTRWAIRALSMEDKSYILNLIEQELSKLKINKDAVQLAMSKVKVMVVNIEDVKRMTRMNPAIDLFVDFGLMELDRYGKPDGYAGEATEEFRNDVASLLRSSTTNLDYVDEKNIVTTLNEIFKVDGSKVLQIRAMEWKDVGQWKKMQDAILTSV